jgi:hypothetical protein
VAVHFGEDSLLRGLRLSIRRDFIDDEPEAGDSRARDIAKSFLYGAVPSAELEVFRGLLTDIDVRPRFGTSSHIWHPTSAGFMDAMTADIEDGRPVPFHKRSRHPLAPIPHKGFLVFCGEEQGIAEEREGFCLDISNVVRENRLFLDMVVMAHEGR